MTMPADKRRYTVAEYLEMEEKATDKHEYWDGEILAMSGGTYSHSKVITNVIGTLWQHLRGKQCSPLDSNMRVRTSAGRYVYPDAQVVCGRPEFDPEDTKQTTILNPTVVIEVLSPSTETYDRVRKFDAYAQVDSMREYVLIDPTMSLVQTYNRQNDGSWRLDRFTDLKGILKLRSLQLDIAMSDIYTNVEFPPPA